MIVKTRKILVDNFTARCLNQAQIFCNYFLIINSLLVISGGIPFTCKTELNQVVTTIMKDFVNASQIVGNKNNYDYEQNCTIHNNKRVIILM